MARVLGTILRRLPGVLAPILTSVAAGMMYVPFGLAVAGLWCFLLDRRID